MALLPFKFFAYIGPRHVATDDPTVYGHWDYMVDFVGAIDPVPPLKYLGLRSLNFTMSALTTALNITGSALPAAAGVWVGPNGTDEGWEYMAYHTPSGVKTALREVQPPQSGVHTSGAPVYLWYPLTMNNGQLQYDEEQSDNLATVTWTAKLSGVMAPAGVLKPEHLILVTGSNDVTATESQMPIVLLGTIERVQMSQDTQLVGSWEIDIVCTSRLLQNSTVPGLRLGPLNIALQADIDASSSLGANWKLTLPQLDEVNAGTLTEIDIVEFQADTGPDNILDGSEDTLWVSDGWVGDRAYFANSAGCKGYASIYAHPVATDPYGTRYLELVGLEALDTMTIWVMGYWWVRDANGTKLEVNPRMQWYQVTESNFFQSQGMDNDSLKQEDSSGDMGMDWEQRIIIAEDLKVFQRVFPAAKAKFMLDASQYSGQDMDMVRRFWWEGGAVFLRFSGSTGDPPVFFDNTELMVTWGEVTATMAEDCWEQDDLTGDFDLPSEVWHIPSASGSYPNQVHLDKPGQVYRRVMTSSTVNITYDYIHMPGYVVNSDIEAEEDNNPSYRSEWFKIVLPEMSHVLRDDITSATTSIYLVDGQQQPNVEGISRDAGGGKIIVDDEIINFTGKNYRDGYLSGCTVTRNHKRGTRVHARWALKAWGRGVSGTQSGGGYDPSTYVPQQDTIKQIATSGYPLERIEWGRGKFHSNGADRYPYAGNYLVKFSVDPDAPDPTADSWLNGYLNQGIDTSPAGTGSEWLQANVSAAVNTAYFDPADDGFRPRTVFFGFRKMWDNFGLAMNIARPRMNYFRAFVDRRYFNPDTWLDTVDEGYDNESQIMELMYLSGQSTGFFQFDPGTVVRSSRKTGQTDRDTAWRVASDMADYGSSVIRCQRVGRVLIGQNNFLLTTDHTATAYLTDGNIINLEIVNVRPAEVGQIRLLWEDPNKHLTGGVATYPSQARYGGTVVEVGPMLMDNQAMADIVAQNLYRTRRFPYNIFVEYITGDWDTLVGDIHEIHYDFLRNGELLYKLMMVETVSQSVSGGVHHTQVGYREIDRDTV